jgi:hypothetical protein
MKHLFCLITFLVLLSLTACGGGGGGAKAPVIPPPPPPVITITTSSLPTGTTGIAYRTALSAAGGTLPYKWDIVNGNLAPEISLSPDGTISGTMPPSSTGTLQTLQFRVMDSAATPNVAFKSLTLDIFGFVPSSLQFGQVGQDYSLKGQLQAGGGIEPLHWSTAGSLPPGLSLIRVPGAPDTRLFDLTGKPTQAGTFQFSVTASDSGSPARTLTYSYSVVVQAPVLKFTDTRVPVAVVGQPYSYSIPFTGGQGPFSWSLIANFNQPLPAGLSFDNSTGTLFGTPSASGYSTFSASLLDQSTPFRQNITWNLFRVLVVPAPLAAHNDSIATAVPIIVPGTYEASISPYRDASGNVSPDQDFYRTTVPAGSIVGVTVSNQVPRYSSQGSNFSLLDPVLELVDANGHRIVACNDPLDDNPPAGASIPQDTTPNAFDDPCMNWTGEGENFGVAVTSRLTFKAPGSSGNVTFYIHVFDWRGDARPDMVYTLDVTQQ